MIIDIKKFVNELKGNPEFDVENTIRSLEGHVTAVVHNKVTKAELHAEQAQKALMDDIAVKELQVENLTKSLEESKNAKEAAVVEAKEEVQKQLDTVSQELSVYRAEKRNAERQSQLTEMINPDLLEDALILANAKGLIRDDMTSEEFMEAMTGFVEKTPTFKFTKAVETPSAEEEAAKQKEMHDADAELEKMKQKFFSGTTSEDEITTKEVDPSFNEDDALDSMREKLGL